MNGKRPGWFPDWSGECAAVIGAGPSLTKADVEKLRGRIHVIAINTSYELCPWADVLYSCDANWWKTVKGAADFPGLKVGFDIDGTLTFPEVNKIKIRGCQYKKWTNQILMDSFGEIGSGANSAYQGCNLAAQFGATAILLLGLDMMDNGKVHWHGRHKWPLSNPLSTNFRDWIEHFKNAAPQFAALGIDVVNCTAMSALQGYPKMTIEDAFKRWTL